MTVVCRFEVGRLLVVPLLDTFRYVHEPLQVGDDALPMLGNSYLVDELRSRILHSRGGAFLITGFRGVGKSTVVLRALDELSGHADPQELLVPVVLSVARSTDIDRLLFAVVRRVFESLNDRGLLARLPVSVQHSLLLAYMRTSLAFKQTQSEAVERGRSIESGSGTGWRVPLPKVSLSAKRTRSLATEAQFLAYSETDVEHDVMRIVSLLHRNGVLGATSSSWLRRLWPWSRAARARLRLVVVLDEADKLTHADSGLAVIERILSGIKNVLTMPGVHFLVVAGPDLHDHALKDAARGNSIYESVFGWRMYVPCSWDAVTQLLEAVTVDRNAEPAQLSQFRSYLRFKARGIPRRLLQEFNSFVSWDENGPAARIPDHDADRVAFYARLEDILSQHLARDDKSRILTVQLDEDRRRLGAYYVVDWVLRSEGEPFSAADLFRKGEDAELDPLLRVSQGMASRLLDHLAEHGILEYVRKANATATMIGASGPIYKLASDVRRALFGFAASNESERAALNISPLSTGVVSSTGAVPLAAAPVPPVRVLANRYELRDVVGRGGMGTVYRGYDRLLRRAVAIKALGYFDLDEPSALARFRREAEIASQLDHSHIVRTYDVVHDDGGGVAIVMELITGPDLGRLVRQRGPLPPGDVAQLGQRLASALTYLESKGVIRIDLKPSNIIMHPARGPVMIDFGIARWERGAALTASGLIIGTPAFMAPEQAGGDTADRRSDIYALGLVLFFCLTGRVPGDSEHISVVLTRRLVEDLDVSTLPVSSELREVVAKATRRHPDDRYQSAADIAAALAETPEGRTEGQLTRTLLTPGTPGPPARDGHTVAGPTLPGVERTRALGLPLPGGSLEQSPASQTVATETPGRAASHGQLP
jgi:serine/threonine-protein kinase